MIDALDALENIDFSIKKVNLEKDQLTDMKTRLIDKHLRYLKMLEDIEDQINDFERLYTQLRKKVLPLKLKQLKANCDQTSEQFSKIKLVVQKTYKFLKKPAIQCAKAFKCTT